MTKFPSVEWFQELGKRMNEDSQRYRGRGMACLSWAAAVEADESCREPLTVGIVFEGWGCQEVKAIRSPEEIEATFTLRAPYAVWRELVENTRANGGADLHHTLNALTILGEPIQLEAPDPAAADLFFRVNQTLQDFFDASAQMETDF